MEERRLRFAVTFRETIECEHTLVIECDSKEEARYVGYAIEDEGPESAGDIVEAAQLNGYEPVAFEKESTCLPSEIEFTGEVEPVAVEEIGQVKTPDRYDGKEDE